MKILGAVVMLAMATAAAGAHRRAAGHESGCTLTLAPRAIDFPAAGGSATISVTMTPGCTWSSNSGAAWVITNDLPNGVSVTVGPTTQARSATIAIGGLPITITQSGVTNLVINGSFDRDLSGWSNIYSTGSGASVWQAIDAGGSSSSGSAQITATQALTGYQLVQCINVRPGVTYDAGVSVLIPPHQDASGVAIFGIYELTVPDCGNTAYTNRWQKFASSATSWTTLTQTIPMQPTTQSIFFIVAGGGAKQPPYVVSYDDAYFREH